MRRLLASAAMLAAAGTAAAQEGGPIRTGEHDGFSRVVMIVEPTTEWSLELGPSEANVVFPRRAIAFTTEAIWQRMSRDRVAAIEPASSATGTAVRLALNCDCRVTASFVGARYLAIDVHDKIDTGDAAPEHQPEAPEAEAAAMPPLEMAERMLIEQLERAAAQGIVELDGEPVTAEVLNPSAPLDDARDADTQAGSRAGGPADVPAVADSAPETRPEPSPRPAPRPVPRKRLVAIAGTEHGGADDSETALLAHLGLPAQDQLLARTVYDRDATAAGRRGSPAPHRECLADDALDVARWSDGRPMPDQGVELRRLLVGEFDRANPAAVRDLARLHVRYGLGTEAAEILRGFAADVDDRALLADLARVVEGRQPEGPLARDIACPGRHGLWLALAGRPAMLADRAHFRSMRTAFEELPPSLRALLGPDLVNRFLDAERYPEARILYDVAIRPGVEPDWAMRYAAGRLAAAERKTAEAEGWLAELVKTNAPNAPDATLALVRTRLDAGGTVPATWIVDLRALAHEHRGTEREPEARSLAAEALARNGDLRDAFAALAALADERPDSLPRIRRLAPRLLAEAEPDTVGRAAYAEAVLEHGRLIGTAPSQDADRLTIATRLLELGLPTAALDLLGPALYRPTEEARLLAARALIALGAAADALEELADLMSPDAAAIRSRAHAADGDFAAASAAMAELGEADVWPLAWAGGDWNLAAEAPDPALAAMAGWMSGRASSRLNEDGEPLTPEAAFQLPVPSLDSPSLRAARSLVTSGREVGAFVEELLTAEE